MNDMTKPPATLEDPKTFPGMLKVYAGEIARALPKHMDGDRMCRIALTEFRKNPSLAKCEPKSIFAAIVVASQMGLEPGVLGQAYLVPYKASKKVNGEWIEEWECQLIPGWQGLTDLVARAGRASVWTGAVFKGDEFEWGMGDRPYVLHRRGDGDEDEKSLTYVYAVGRIKNAEWPIVEVWSIAKVKSHLARYNKVGDRHYALKGNLEMYGRKVALLQVLKYMPKSTDVASAMELDSSGGRSQGLGLTPNDKGVLEGTWAVETESEEAPAQAEKARDEGKPALDDAAFAKKLPGWQKLIEDGKKTADEVIATAKSKNALSSGQEEILRGIKPAGAPQ